MLIGRKADILSAESVCLETLHHRAADWRLPDADAAVQATGGDQALILVELHYVTGAVCVRNAGMGRLPRIGRAGA